MATKKYPCYRCSGKGHIAAFGHVLGGVCFKCGGSGKQSAKPSKSITWSVLDANGLCFYNVKAPTAVQAVQKALVMFTKASDEFRVEHDLTSVVAVPYEEYWTPERIEELGDR